MDSSRRVSGFGAGSDAVDLEVSAEPLNEADARGQNKFADTRRGLCRTQRLAHAVDGPVDGRARVVAHRIGQVGRAVAEDLDAVEHRLERARRVNRLDDRPFNRAREPDISRRPGIGFGLRSGDGTNGVAGLDEGLDAGGPEVAGRLGASER